MNNNIEDAQRVASGVLASGVSSIASYLNLMKDANEGIVTLQKSVVHKSTIKNSHADAKKKAKRKASRKSRAVNRHK